PMDNDGAFAPTGTPGQFITINDDAWGGSTGDQLWIYELDVDWVTPGTSTFSRVQQLNVASFDSNFGSTWDNIAQPGTSQKLDAINQILMHRAQYRNFSGSQHVVCNHTVDVDATDHAGIRWYELEYDGANWEVRQFGTYAPDGDSRWMGSIAMNVDHEIGLGYSVSSSSTYPSIRYTGQSASENASASGILDIAETSIQAGTASQTSSERWGDYSNLAVDADDDHTFWFTTEYNISGGQKGTKIASFEFTPAPPLADFIADDLTPLTTDVVQFTDLSSGAPTSWSWTFTPSTITYQGGTTSASQNPEVMFDAAGFYTVEMTATNANGSNTVTKVDYIEASLP
ncbi:MAG: PKD domain-containing protein, partial [Bacteroidales bacterium]|nr:PKD domain-containing protein [Bacteroidales bacterium]